LPGVAPTIVPATFKDGPDPDGHAAGLGSTPIFWAPLQLSFEGCEKRLEVRKIRMTMKRTFMVGFFEYQL
jgi:hypothetical protein